MQQQQGLTSLNASAKLAPEVILHIFSFLMLREQPSSLCPILTVSKQWARLALELIYEQPAVRLTNLGAFVKTLTLQDHLQNGQKPFWDTSNCSTTNLLNTGLEQSLGIDYRSMIKKPCLIIGAAAPVKQDLIHLWDLQALLWATPSFSTNQLSSSPTKSFNITMSSPLTPPATPPVPQSPISLSPTMPSDTEYFTSSDSSENTNYPKTLQATSTKFTSPSQPKAVLLRQKKKSPLPIGPVVLLLDVSQVFSDTMHYILNQVPGMKLRRLHYKSRLSVSITELLERNISTLRDLTFSRSPTRQDEFMTIAQLLCNAKNLDALKLDHCQAAGSTVLTQFARSCGPYLRVLEIQQNIMIRPLGDHSHFPVDGPEDWNLNPSVFPLGQDRCSGTATHQLTSQSSLHEQGCSHFYSSGISDPTTSIVSVVDQLNISDEVEMNSTEASITEPAGESIPAEVDLESRMDLSLKEFSSHCTQLSRLRLQHLTWLSDDALSGFKPQHDQNISDTDLCGQNRFQGLREIKILDSYYGSRLTLEGVIDLCGPNLEVLVLDRKSCWRTRPSPRVRYGMCNACTGRVQANQAKMARVSSGDQLILGLIHKRSGRYRSSIKTERIHRLDTLVLIEHWVTLQVLKEAIECWRLTLRVLNLRLFKCSIEGLMDAFIFHEGCTGTSAALENLSLGLPWLDVGDREVTEFVTKLFGNYSRLRCLEINYRIWTKEEVSPGTDRIE
ncbi:hypothetical protein BGX27_004791 [Mortierella sp. AM989]|nr:hypothetical protein BGX27_004791 [Mortierella sp. AM989]